MEPRAHLITELGRRAGVLDGEFEAWVALSETNTDKFGIHLTQIHEIEATLGRLKSKLQEALALLEPHLDHDEFATRYAKASLQLVANNSVAAVFRHILTQRIHGKWSNEPSNPRTDLVALEHFEKALRYADLIAENCYERIMRDALKLNLFKESWVRVPPLTYLSPESGPNVAIREVNTFRAVSFPVCKSINLMLPVSVIALPVDYTSVIWKYCSLYHEVGHLVDYDLMVRAGLEAPLIEHLGAENIDAESRSIWVRWLEELVADTFGVLLGGEGFVLFMFDVLFGTHQHFTSIVPGGRHPTPIVRMYFLTLILETLRGSEGAEAARQIYDNCRQIYGESDLLSDQRRVCQIVAHLVLNTPFQLSNNARLLNFNSGAERNHKAATLLAYYFATGNQEPTTVETQIPAQIVPAAARLALVQVSENHGQIYQQIQNRAEEYTEGLQHPPFMGAHADLADAPEHRQHMDDLLDEFISQFSYQEQE